MKIENLYKIKENFVAREVDNELVVVPLVSNVATMDRLYTLNETAAFLWEKLEEGSTLESLTESLLNDFEVEAEVAKNDVQHFINELLKLSTGY